jgi:MFS-type transporter involved in bile tolerance (Atg22 family)
LEDSLAAELVAKQQHGLAFGLLSTVNGVGDCLSSIVVGVLWSVCGLGVALSYSLVLFVAGALLLLGVQEPGGPAPPNAPSFPAPTSGGPGGG